MASLFVRTYTFTDGTTAYGSQVESEIANIVNVLNNLNTAATTWGQVSALHATSVPLIADCAAGTQDIADFKNNSVIKASISSAGLLTAVGATLSDNITFSPTTKGIKGTTTNDSAAAGNVGQYIESLVSAPGNFPSTGTYNDATSVSLTAGDWDVTGMLIVYQAASSVVTSVILGISTSPGNDATGLVDGQNRTVLSATGVTNYTNSSLPSIPCYRVSLTTTTSVYLKMQATYTSGPPQYRCRLSARRVR